MRKEKKQDLYKEIGFDLRSEKTALEEILKKYRPKKVKSNGPLLMF